MELRLSERRTSLSSHPFSILSLGVFPWNNALESEPSPLLLASFTFFFPFFLFQIFHFFYFPSSYRRTCVICQIQFSIFRHQGNPLPQQASCHFDFCLSLDGRIISNKKYNDFVFLSWVLPFSLFSCPPTRFKRA